MTVGELELKLGTFEGGLDHKFLIAKENGTLVYHAVPLYQWSAYVSAGGKPALNGIPLPCAHSYCMLDANGFIPMMQQLGIAPGDVLGGGTVSEGLWANNGVGHGRGIEVHEGMVYSHGSVPAPVLEAIAPQLIAWYSALNPAVTALSSDTVDPYGIWSENWKEFLPANSFGKDWYYEIGEGVHTWM